MLPTFLLAMWVIFSGLLDIATDQTDSLREANELHAERLGTLVSIASTGATNCPYLFMAGVDNSSSKKVSFGDFSKIDFFVDYTNVTGDNTAEWLGYPSSWTVSSITGDNSNLNMWDPGETANIIFSVIPELQAGSKGTLAVAVPGGSSDSAYFDAGPQRTC